MSGGADRDLGWLPVFVGLRCWCQQRREPFHFASGRYPNGRPCLTIIWENASRGYGEEPITAVVYPVHLLFDHEIYLRRNAIIPETKIPLFSAQESTPFRNNPDPYVRAVARCSCKAARERPHFVVECEEARRILREDVEEQWDAREVVRLLRQEQNRKVWGI